MVFPLSEKFKVKRPWYKNRPNSSHEEQVSDTMPPFSHPQQQASSSHQSPLDYPPPKPSRAAPTHIHQQPYSDNNSHLPMEGNHLNASHPYRALGSVPHDTLVPNRHHPSGAPPQSVSNEERVNYTSNSNRIPPPSSEPHVNLVCGPSFPDHVNSYGVPPVGGNSSHTAQPHQEYNADTRGSQTLAPHTMSSLNPNGKPETSHRPSSHPHLSHSGAMQSTGTQSQCGSPSTQAEIPGIALVGNPGSGKSTILNGFADEIVFSSGISLASGLTTTLNEYIIRGITLYDTPGLADVEQKKKAGEELDKLLSKHVPIKIAFVVTLERGRVRPEDSLTIELVLDSIKCDTRDKFGVIINQVTKRVREELKASPENEAKIRSSLTGKHSTSHWCYVDERRDLVDESNRKLMTPDLMHFFWGLPETKPKDARTVPVDTDSMKEKLKKHIQIIEDIKAANAEQLRKMTEELRLQKEQDAVRESQLRLVEQNLSNEIHRLKAEAAAAKAAAEAASKGAGRHEPLRNRLNQNRISGSSQRIKKSLGQTVALALIPAVVGPTVVEGYRTMHMHHSRQPEQQHQDPFEMTGGNEEGSSYATGIGTTETGFGSQEPREINANDSSVPLDSNENAYNGNYEESQPETNIDDIGFENDYDVMGFSDLGDFGC